MSIGETKSIDITKDGFNDIKINLIKINNELVDYSIEKIEEGVAGITGKATIIPEPRDAVEVGEKEPSSILKSEYFDFKINKSYLIIGIIILTSIVLSALITVITLKSKSKHKKIAVITSKLQQLRALKARKEISPSAYHKEKDRLLYKFNGILRGKYLILILGALVLITSFILIPELTLTGGAIGIGESNLRAISWWVIFGVLAIALAVVGLAMGKANLALISQSHLDNKKVDYSTNSISELINKKVFTNSGHYLGEVKEAILGENRIDSLMIKLDRKLKSKFKGITVKYKNVRSVGHVVIIDKEILDKFNSLNA